MPIGGVIAYRDAISPSGVGYDIGCGNKAVLTNIMAEDIEGSMEKIMDTIWATLEFGMGRRNPNPVDHELFDDPLWHEIPQIKNLKDLARNQLGTIGAGNHYVDIFSDEIGRVWIGVHFGSRGFGHKVCTGFMNLAKGKKFTDKPGHEDMNARATVFSMKESMGQAYFYAMGLAGEYAHAGRDYVCQEVLKIVGAESLEEVHNHHNFAWKETHRGEEFYVVRKGATPAWPGQKCFIGGSMGDNAVIAEGVESGEAINLLRSTVHGAGRVMSRTRAAGKFKRVDGKRTRVGGEVSRDDMNRWIHKKGVVLRGADTDESPQAYKRLDAVLEEHQNALKILHTLRPIGVAMAGPHTYDAFKD
jgi:tRNA-splicing ligase RtcB